MKVNKKKLNINFYVIFFVILIQVLIFQNLLQQYIPILRYIDEILAIVLALKYCFNIILKKKITIREFILFVFCIVITFMGLLANYKYNIQPNKVAVYSDIVSIFKFYMVYIGLKNISSRFYNTINIKSIINISAFFAKIYLITLSIFAIINLFININMHYEIRYGLRAFSFIYGGAGHIVNHSSYLLIILCIQSGFFPKKNNLIFIIISLLLMISTLRARAFVLVVIFIILYYYLLIRKKNKLTFEVPIILSSILVSGYSQFEHYFLSGETPRSRFVNAAIELIKEYFPLGTGFGTFGSSAAADYYSPLYYRFDFHLKYGMGPSDPMYLNDNYFPMIFGQLGLIAGCMFMVFIFIVFRDIWYRFKNSGQISRLVCLFYIFDTVFSSVQSSYLAHYSVVTLTFITIFLGGALKNKED